MHFLDIAALDPAILKNLVKRSLELKKAPFSSQCLENKTVGLLFEKPSLRTRVSFEVGITQCGGSPITLHEAEVGLGKREAVKDVAKVISRFVDMIMIRTFSHELLQEFAEHATIPVINGLTDFSHPCQAVADAVTIYEAFGTGEGLNCVYLGDANNVCRSFVEMCSALKMNPIISAPHTCESIQAPHVIDPLEAVRQADVMYTDTWISMGEEGKTTAAFEPYQVNATLLQAAKPSAIVLHCLPAHRGDEITDEVIDGPQSRVYDQAENRCHAQKAIMEWLISK